MASLGNIFVVAAPSGAGKSTLVNAVCRKVPNIQLSISHTTRIMRPGEENGREYFFVKVAEFQKMIANNEFLEYAMVYDNYYGTNINTIKTFLSNGKDILLEIDHQGAWQIKQVFPQAILIFIAPPSLNCLRERLEKRNTDSCLIIEQRLNLALDDLSHAKEFDYIIINDDFNTALADLYSIIRVPYLKTNYQLPVINKLFNL